MKGRRIIQLLFDLWNLNRTCLIFKYRPNLSISIDTMFTSFVSMFQQYLLPSSGPVVKGLNLNLKQHRSPLTLGRQRVRAVSPVSYTHLDVYKRQPFWCGEKELCGSCVYQFLCQEQNEWIFKTINMIVQWHGRLDHKI